MSIFDRYGKVGGVRVKCPKCVVYVVRPKANEHEINHHSPGLPEKCPHCDYATLTKVYAQQFLLSTRKALRVCHVYTCYFETIYRDPASEDHFT